MLCQVVVGFRRQPVAHSDFVCRYMDRLRGRSNGFTPSSSSSLSSPSSSSPSSLFNSVLSLEELSLPSALESMITTLRNVPDDKLRYQQLLFLATKCPAMPAELKVAQNKVPGCLSTVHVHATMSEGKVFYVGKRAGCFTVDNS
jgi:Fe-S metabolism associated domain